MKSKGALLIILMHNGLLHRNHLVVYFILLYVHSSQHHLHFHSTFTIQTEHPPRELNISLVSVSMYKSTPNSDETVYMSLNNIKLTCSVQQWEPSRTQGGCLRRCGWKARSNAWVWSAGKPATDERQVETFSLQRSWQSGRAAAFHTGRTGQQPHQAWQELDLFCGWLVEWLELGGMETQK